MIRSINVRITAGTITISARNGKEIHQEVYRYKKGAKPQIDCISGNFEDEPVINRNEELLCALCSLYDPACDALLALNSQEKTP